jgi:hypothetical protein
VYPQHHLTLRAVLPTKGSVKMGHTHTRPPHKQRTVRCRSIHDNKCTAGVPAGRIMTVFIKCRKHHHSQLGKIGGRSDHLVPKSQHTQPHRSICWDARQTTSNCSSNRGGLSGSRYQPAHPLCFATAHSPSVAADTAFTGATGNGWPAAIAPGGQSS